VIVSADGGETLDGLKLVAPQTAVSPYTLTYPMSGTNDLALIFALDNVHHFGSI